jgi:hypothetical protein
LHIGKVSSQKFEEEQSVKLPEKVSHFRNFPRFRDVEHRSVKNIDWKRRFQLAPPGSPPKGLGSSQEVSVSGRAFCDVELVGQLNLDILSFVTLEFDD